VEDRKALRQKDVLFISPRGQDVDVHVPRHGTFCVDWSANRCRSSYRPVLTRTSYCGTLQTIFVGTCGNIQSRRIPVISKLLLPKILVELKMHLGSDRVIDRLSILGSVIVAIQT
jgi:hypothetical protein